MSVRTTLARARRGLAILCLLLVPGACGGEPASVAASAPADGTPVRGVHDVRCGCVIEGVGHCGNYVDVGGHWLEITGEVGLGEMEFCGEDGVRATVEGTIGRGAFAATSLDVVE